MISIFGPLPFRSTYDTFVLTLIVCLKKKMDIKNLIDLKDKTFYAAVRWRGSINATTQSQKQERVLFVIVLYLMLLTPLSFTGLEYFVKFYNVLILKSESSILYTCGKIRNMHNAKTHKGTPHPPLTLNHKTFTSNLEEWRRIN